MFNWFQLIKLAQVALYDFDLFREPLKQYIQRQFPEHSENQLLLFDLTHDDFINAILDKVINIPVAFVPQEYLEEKPYGILNGERWLLSLGGIDKDLYESGNTHYTDYVDSVIFHELVHAQLWGSVNNIDYNPIDLGDQYYGHPEEQRAYTAQFRFLKDFLGLQPHVSRQIMNDYSSDPDKETRRNWINKLTKMNWFQKIYANDSKSLPLTFVHRFGGKETPPTVIEASNGRLNHRWLAPCGWGY